MHQDQGFRRHFTKVKLPRCLLGNGDVTMRVYEEKYVYSFEDDIDICAVDGTSHRRRGKVPDFFVDLERDFCRQSVSQIFHLHLSFFLGLPTPSTVTE